MFELTEADGTTRRLEVKIPVGVNDGLRIRIAGQGMQGNAGRGDLYLVVHIVPDARFTREGTDVRTHVDVPLMVAISRAVSPRFQHLMGVNYCCAFQRRHRTGKRSACAGKACREQASQIVVATFMRR